jgi:hypothetical protein
MFCRSTLFAIAGLSALLSACAAAEDTSSTASSTRGAGYTTFPGGLDQDVCDPGATNGVNCNHYICQDFVYVNGGPNRPRGGNTLEDGEYYFAVLAPGHQNGGAADGAVGNLSDTTAHGGTDLGSGDSWTDRRFRMSGGTLTNEGTHANAVSPNGQPIVRVAPFDVTPNPGGVYILAICPVVDGVPSADPSDCKFDAFKTERCGGECDEKCHEGDTDCTPCPPVCDPDCKPDSDPQIKSTDTDGGTCIPCEPNECDPKCTDAKDCTPCL